MSIKIPWILEKKELNAAILNFLDSENSFESITQIIEKQEIVDNRESVLNLIQMLSILEENHYRTPNFFDKLGLILDYLSKYQLLISSTEIIENYKQNKRFLLLLFEHNIIQPNESIGRYLMKNKESKKQKLQYYLYPKVKIFLGKRIEKEITKEFKESIESFESKCKKGENDSYICNLIREDSIQEFIIYISSTNLPLTSKIKADFYESNKLLIDNEPSLMEYAFFYGSIQIIKYLQNNHIKITRMCWLYAIHSNNPEMIELLEENKICYDDKSYLNCVVESIKCHHNEIADHIKDNLLNNSQNKDCYDIINQSIVDSCNYYYYPDDLSSIISNYQDGYFKMLYLNYSNFIIPSTITKIGNSAFSCCGSLAQITIPSSVTSIGDYAFNGCSALAQIAIPSSVTSIGDYAFDGCSALAQITIPSSITSIGDYAFDGCSSLTQITIPSSVTEIGKSAFKECSSLKQIAFEIPSSVTSIGDYAFNGCSALAQIAIPSSVTSIGDYAFDGCSSLTQITIPSSVTSIGKSAFKKCSSLKQIAFEIPSSVSSIGHNSFEECSSLTQITIPSSVTSIGNYAFSCCRSLTQVAIPSSITVISDFTFYFCSSLTQITIPSSITAIGQGAFYECSSLTQTALPLSDKSFQRIHFWIPSIVMYSH